MLRRVTAIVQVVEGTLRAVKLCCCVRVTDGLVGPRAVTVSGVCCRNSDADALEGIGAVLLRYYVGLMHNKNKRLYTAQPLPGDVTKPARGPRFPSL